MPDPRHLTVLAHDLRPGDIVSSGETVIAIDLLPYPSRSVTVALRSKDGHGSRLATWGARTTVGIRRATEEEGQ